MYLNLGVLRIQRAGNTNPRPTVRIPRSAKRSVSRESRAMPPMRIVIRMFVEAGGQHHRSHFHAYYQDHVAVFAVDTLDCLGGSLPKAQRRLVEAWAEIHRAELQVDWELLQSGQPPVKIEPLR